MDHNLKNTVVKRTMLKYFINPDNLVDLVFAPTNEKEKKNRSRECHRVPIPAIDSLISAAFSFISRFLSQITIFSRFCSPETKCESGFYSFSFVSRRGEEAGPGENVSRQEKRNKGIRDKDEECRAGDITRVTRRKSRSTRSYATK